MSTTGFSHVFDSIAHAPFLCNRLFFDPAHLECHGQPRKAQEQEDSCPQIGHRNQPETFIDHHQETKHHQRHAKEMGFKNTKEYEKAAIEFFNSSKGKLYYSLAKNRFYKYQNLLLIPH